MKCPYSAPFRAASVSMNTDTLPVGKSKTRGLPRKVTRTTSFRAVFLTDTVRMSSFWLRTSPEASVNVAGLVTSARAGAGRARRASARRGRSRFMRLHSACTRVPAGTDSRPRRVPGGALVVRRPHHVGDRQRLAGQPDAVREVLVVEDVVVEHLHLALEQPDGAGRAL